MSPRTPDPWSWSAGEYGNTVTVYERKVGGNLYIRFADPGRASGMVRRSLGHDDRSRAKAQAERIAAALREDAEMVREGRITLARVFALYEREKIGRLSTEQQKVAERRRIKMFTRFLGGGVNPTDLSLAEWESFTEARSTGRIGPRGKVEPDPDEREGVKLGTVRHDLKWLRKVFRWATRWRAPRGGDHLMESNPLDGYELPQEPNTRRPVATRERYEKMRAAAKGLEERPQVKVCYLLELLDLVAHTGRRIGAVRKLRYEDVRLEETERAPFGAIHWPAETDKTKAEWWTPINEEARAALDRVMEERPGIGRGWMFPAPRDRERPVSNSTVYKWFRKAEKDAELEHRDQGGFHEYRRMWATERKHLPHADVAEAGGWKDATTLQKVYQQADDEGVLRAVLEGGELREKDV